MQRPLTAPPSESAPTHPAGIPLLDVDPDLGAFLDPARSREARRQLLVRVRRLARGPCDLGKLSVGDPGHLGLLILDGVLMRETLTSHAVAAELIGPGDVVRPWQLVHDSSLLKIGARWNVLAEASVTVLDRRVAERLGAYPEVTSLLFERMHERIARLAVGQAIAQLNRVDERLLSLMWHLAERWGRMTTDGVLLPLRLSHRLLAQLVGARRPTVSTALAELGRTGRVVRRSDGAWLLHGAPPAQPDPRSVRFVPPRRRLMATADGDKADGRVSIVDATRGRPLAGGRFARPAS